MSKGLEALQNIKEIFTCHDFDFMEKCEVIEKELKALEIVKIKRVDVELLMKVTSAKDYNRYSKNVNQSHNLGDREFDFLREVLA